MIRNVSVQKKMLPQTCYNNYAFNSGSIIEPSSYPITTPPNSITQCPQPHVIRFFFFFLAAIPPAENNNKQNPTGTWILGPSLLFLIIGLGYSCYTEVKTHFGHFIFWDSFVLFLLTYLNMKWQIFGPWVQWKGVQGQNSRWPPFSLKNHIFSPPKH